MERNNRPIDEFHPSAEQKGELLNVLSYVNEVLDDGYPGIPKLSVGQIKFIPKEDFDDFTEATERSNLHPSYIKAIENALNPNDIARFTPLGTAGFIKEQTNNLYATSDFLEHFESKEVSYLRLGLFLINQSIVNAAKTVIQSEGAKDHAKRITTSAFSQAANALRVSFDESLSETFRVIDDSEPKTYIRGLSRTSLIDGKKIVSLIDLPKDAIVINYLARPIRQDFATLLANEMNMPAYMRQNAMKLAETIDIDSYSTDLQVIMGRKQRERAFLDELSRMGFRGRMNIFNSYVSGEIGKKFASKEQQN